MILLEHDGPVARLVLNRQGVRNALAVSDWESLAARIGEVHSSPARLLVVSGAGSAFCAGADLSEFGTLQTDEAARKRFRLAMRGAIDGLRALPIATIAHVEGPCFGAGVALAMGCDLRIADPAARFAITPAKMGIGYPQEDVARLVSLVGPGWASRLLFTGAPIDAEQAERIGLVEAVGSPAEADALTEAILACDPASIAMLRRGISLACDGKAQDDEQDRRFESLFGSEALADRLSRRGRDSALPPSKA